MLTKMPKKMNPKAIYWRRIADLATERGISKKDAQQVYKTLQNGHKLATDAKQAIEPTLPANGNIVVQCNHNSPSEIIQLARTKCGEIEEIISTTEQSLSDLRQSLTEWKQIRDSLAGK